MPRQQFTKCWYCLKSLFAGGAVRDKLERSRLLALQTALGFGVPNHIGGALGFPQRLEEKLTVRVALRRKGIAGLLYSTR